MLSIDFDGTAWQNNGMSTTKSEATLRPDAILDAAFGAFAAYGYRRTTMEDIAHAAGLSRTALYLHFRSKEDLFRSLTLRHFDGCLSAMEQALSAPGKHSLPDWSPKPWAERRNGRAKELDLHFRLFR